MSFALALDRASQSDNWRHELERWAKAELCPDRRRKELTDEQRAYASAMLATGWSVSTIAHQLKVARARVHELKASPSKK